MSRYNKNLGDFGEYVAADFLEAKGYRILEKNYKIKGGELDIVAESKSHLVFVEVKTRKNERYGTPAEAVNFRKQQHIVHAAKSYLCHHPTQKEIRFDVIEIYAEWINDMPRLKHIHHIENIILEVLD